MSTSLQYTKEDDFVECFLFPTFCYESTEETTRDLLTSEINKFNNEIEKYTKDYMWHRDSLAFQPRSKNEMLLDKELRGVTESEGKVRTPLFSSYLFPSDSPSRRIIDVTEYFQSFRPQLAAARLRGSQIRRGCRRRVVPRLPGHRVDESLRRVDRQASRLWRWILAHRGRKRFAKLGESADLSGSCLRL